MPLHVPCRKPPVGTRRRPAIRPGRARAARSGLPALAFWSLLLLATGAAHAGRITLDTETTCRLVAEETAGADREDVPLGLCEVRLSNRGDEAATDLTVGVEFDTVVVGTESVARLAPDDTWEGSFTLAPEALRIGRNGLVVRIDYHDREGYPLAALSHAYLDRGPPHLQALEATMSAVELSGAPRTIELEVRNTGTRPRTITACLIVPRTLRSDSPSTEAVVAPGETVELTFTLDNFSAFADSTYRIYGLLESDLDGVRETVFVPANASITTGERPTGRLRTLLAAVAGLLVGAWLMAQFQGRSRQQPPATHGGSTESHP